MAFRFNEREPPDRRDDDQGDAPPDAPQWPVYKIVHGHLTDGAPVTLRLNRSTGVTDVLTADEKTHYAWVQVPNHLLPPHLERMIDSAIWKPADQ